MIEAVRLGRDSLIKEFGCSRRLATRLGALMSRHVAISATLLEEAAPGSGMEKLLLCKEFLSELPVAEVLQSLSSQENFSALFEDLPLVTVEQEGWIVIAAEEETLAESGWSEADAASTSDSAASLPVKSSGFDVGSVVSGGRNDFNAGENASAFSPAEIARLRVNIFAGSGSSEKVSALRQLAYADIPEAEKRGIFLQAMAAEDAKLRAAAAKGICSLGVEHAVGDAARILAEGEDEERKMAVERLRDLSPASGEAGRDAILMAFLGFLRDEDPEPQMLCAVLDCLAGSASSLGANRICLEDVLRVMFDILPSAKGDTLAAVRRVIMAMEDVRPGWAARIMMTEAKNTGSVRYRGLLLEVFCRMELSDEMHAELIGMAAEALLALPCDLGSGRAVDGFLLKSGEPAMRALAEKLPQADTAHRRHIIRMFDNALRSFSMSDEARDMIASAGLAALRDGTAQVRFDLIETCVCARGDISEKLRSDIASAYLADFHEYTQWPLSETMENALVRLGGAAVGPLLASLGEQSSEREGALLTGALGRIGLELVKAGGEENIALAEEILRELNKLLINKGRFEKDILLAMGRVCSLPGVSFEASGLVLRTLTSRIKNGPGDENILEPLGMVCGGAQSADGEAIAMVAELAKSHLTAIHSDPSIRMSSMDGEDVFELEEGVDVYASLIPAGISCLQHLTLSPHTDRALSAQLVDVLLDCWKKNVSFEIQWGPANVSRLTEALGNIGANPATNGEAKVQIAYTLAKSVSDIPVLMAMAGILDKGDKGTRLMPLDRLAGALATRVLKILESSDELSSEDREMYLRVLSRIVARGRFSAPDGKADRLMERSVDALVAGLRQGIPGVMQSLVYLREEGELPKNHAENLKKRLADYTSVALRPRR